MKTLTLNQITEQRVRAILTGSPTPASDLKALWCNLSHAEQAQALGYFGSVSTLNEHAIYIVNATPIASLIEETLTDGSHVYNIAIGEQEIPCMSRVAAYQALDEIAAALKKATSEFVFVA